MFVGGGLYPLHMAISPDWKVHYFSADMADRADHRALDEAFLTQMGTALGAPAIAALERIRDRLGLDYAGIDFAVNAAGEVVVFEANATMVVAVPGNDERWAYRRNPVERVIDAARAMVLANARTRDALAMIAGQPANWAACRFAYKPPAAIRLSWVPVSRTRPASM